jgi:erythromycin esterase
VQCDAEIRHFSALLAGDAAAPAVNIRDCSMADTVEWILGREERIVILAHNAHLQRTLLNPEMFGVQSTSQLGHHLAARLGKQYLPIGSTCGSGTTFNNEMTDDGEPRWAIVDLPPVGPDTVDGLIAANRSEPGILDLRALAPSDVALIDAAPRMRALHFTMDVSSVRQAFDMLVHLPHISPWHSPVTEML